MRRIFCLWVALLACVWGNPAALAAQPQRGTLYRVSYQDHTTWLFGTIHVGQPAFYPLESTVQRAFDTATTVAIELDPRDQVAMQQAVARHGMYPDGETVAQHISSRNLERLKQALLAKGVPFAAVARMRPWMLANMLMVLELDRNGYKMDQSVELHLLKQAGNKTVLALESAEEQMALFDQMSVADQERYLRESLEMLDDGSALKKTRVLVDGWAAADQATMDRVMAEMLVEDTVTSAFLRRVLLDQRNQRMTAKIEALLRQEGTSFVAVGLLHLLGERGLPALLRARGYKVERLY